MALLPLESVIIFDIAALVSGVSVLFFGYRLDKIVPLHLLYLGMPVYIIGGFITWYGVLALVADMSGAEKLHRELQPVVMAIIGIMLATMLRSLLIYARQATGLKA